VDPAWRASGSRDICWDVRHRYPRRARATAPHPLSGGTFEVDARARALNSNTKRHAGAADSPVRAPRRAAARGMP